MENKDCCCEKLTGPISSDVYSELKILLLLSPIIIGGILLDINQSACGKMSYIRTYSAELTVYIYLGVNLPVSIKL